MATEKKPAGNTETGNTQPNETVKKAPTVAKRSAKKAAEEEQDPEVKIETAINRTEEFIYRNGKSLLTALVVIVLLIGGFMAYKYLYLGNRSEKAGAAMFVAQHQFEVDSFELALLGDGNNAGFIDIANKFGNTPEGNIANHYAGICYMQLGDFDNAYTYLAKYKTTSGVPNKIINAQNAGLQADIHVQKAEYDKAADKYKKAIDESDNSLITPYYLKKLALVYDQLGRYSDAKAAFQRLYDEYPASMEARDAEKYIGGLEQKL